MRSSHELILNLLEGFEVNDILDAINYNIKGGKGLRSEIYLDVGLKENNGSLTQHHYNTAFAFELLQGALTCMDDFIDNSDIRRGKQCYYRIRGNQAVKDGMLLVSIFFKFIKRGDRKDIIFILNQTAMGELLDCSDKTVASYTFGLYDKICECKTSVYSIFMPIYLGVRNRRESIKIIIYEISKLVGKVMQMMDDFINFIPEISRKTGNDLEEKKITFFTCMLAKEYKDDEMVRKYFDKGVVTESLIKKVRTYFPTFFQKVSEIVAEAFTTARTHKLERTFEKVLNLINGYYIKVKEFAGESN